MVLHAGLDQLASDYCQPLNFPSRVDEDDRLRMLHELIEQAVKLQQDSQKLVAELTRQIDSVREIANKVDRRKKPRR